MVEVNGGTDATIEQQTQDAISTLQRMSEFMASRSSLRFTADIQYDAVQDSGQKIEFGSHRQIAMRTPDRARVEVSHRDGGRELVIFDGSRISAAIPNLHVYASTMFSGTIGEAFDQLVDEHASATPLADLLRPDLPKEVASRVISARHLGDTTILGSPCDHLIFRGKEVDFQIFVSQGESPVPLRFVIDYKSSRGAPQFRAQLRDWELDKALPDFLFHFVPPTGAQRVPFPELLDLLLGPPIAAEEDRQ
jgi:hypothetical protein